MKTGYENIQSNVEGFGSLNIFYNAGAKIESEKYRGISHLAEHLISKVIEPIEEQLDAHGIHQNAITSENFVMFYFNGLNKNIKKFEEKLLGVLNYSPTEIEFEKEKQIVLREYDNTFSEKRSLILNILRKYFNAYSAIGCRQDIQNISYQDYIEFQNKYFKNPAYILRVGETDLKDFYSGLDYENSTEANYIEEERNVEPECNTSSKNIFYVDWVNSSIDNKDLTLVEFYLSYGLMSPLYKELRDKLGLVYYVQADSMKIGSRRLFNIMYESDAKSEKVIRKSINQIVKGLSNNVSETRFQNVKKAIESIIQKQTILNYSVDFAKNFSDDDFYTEEWFEEMTFEKFKDILRTFCEEFVNVKHSKLGRKLKV